MDDPPNEAWIELVRRTAALARLEVSDEEARTLGPQFAAILEHFRTLATLDLGRAEPMTAATRLFDVRRADEPRASQPRDTLLSNAPRRAEGFFSVPKTIGGPE